VSKQASKQAETHPQDTPGTHENVLCWSMQGMEICCTADGYILTLFPKGMTPDRAVTPLWLYLEVLVGRSRTEGSFCSGDGAMVANWIILQREEDTAKPSRPEERHMKPEISETCGIE
jgi:hypothetical protein